MDTNVSNLLKHVELPRGWQLLENRAYQEVSFSGDFLNLQICIISVHTGSLVGIFRLSWHFF